VNIGELFNFLIFSAGKLLSRGDEIERISFDLSQEVNLVFGGCISSGSIVRLFSPTGFAISSDKSK
jgi:hypothetical protein